MNRHIVPILAALLAGPAGATAQAGAETSVQLRAESGVEARAGGSTSVEATLAATLRAGLPDAPVRRTVQEERARGASEEEVARAAARTHARLLVSRDALAEGAERTPSRAEVAAGARALAAGMREADLLTVAGSAPPSRELSASLDALARLRGQGMGSAEATARVASALRGGASDRALASLEHGGRPSAGAAAGAGAAVRGVLGGGARVSGAVTGGLRLP